jgi:hypothetical protein
MKQLDAIAKVDIANAKAIQGLICLAAQLAHEVRLPLTC